ncbi:MAG TPA: YcaO-like family protein [Syntrophales bacterium]|nr:YcaO-like family protein [Syntrophales bacterium]
MVQRKTPSITLKECPKVYILETHRSKTPDSTLQFVENIRELIRMNGFREASDLDRIGIPVFICHRIRPDKSKTSHTGKGVSPIQAQVSLTMESIERYSSEFRDEYRDKLIKGNYNGLKNNYNVLDPRTMILSKISDYDDEKEIHWIQGCDLARGEDILVPACAVYHPYHLDDAFLMDTHTNGIAAGNTMEEAVVHGLAELIERDAWSIARYDNNFSDALFIEDDPDNRFIIDIFEKFENAEIEIVAKDITSDIGVSVIAAFSRDLVHPTMKPIDGFGAHLDPRVAMVRALLEIVTTRALLIQKFGIEALCEHVTAYLGEREGDDDPRFYSYGRKGLREIEVLYSEDILEDVKTMIGKLKARGLDRVIAVDLTRADTGVPTVRMIVPGLEAYCFDRMRMGARLLKSETNG